MKSWGITQSSFSIKLLVSRLLESVRKFKCHILIRPKVLSIFTFFTHRGNYLVVSDLDTIQLLHKCYYKVKEFLFKDRAWAKSNTIKSFPNLNLSKVIIFQLLKRCYNSSYRYMGAINTINILYFSLYGHIS